MSYYIFSHTFCFLFTIVSHLNIFLIIKIEQFLRYQKLILLQLQLKLVTLDEYISFSLYKTHYNPDHLYLEPKTISLASLSCRLTPEERMTGGM